MKFYKIKHYDTNMSTNIYSSNYLKQFKKKCLLKSLK